MKKVAANDDNFFVFEDTMHQVCQCRGSVMLIFLHIKCQVLLCFLHDKSVLFCLDHLSLTPMKAYMTGNDMMVCMALHAYTVYVSLIPRPVFLLMERKVYRVNTAWGRG